MAIRGCLKAHYWREGVERAWGTGSGGQWLREKGEEALGCSLSHGCLSVRERTDVHEEEDERFASGLLGQLGQIGPWL
jgi:hypothetical protein